MSKIIKIQKGDRFGRLSIIKEIITDKPNRHFLCQCNCGNTRIIQLGHLRDGHTVSCGCFNIETAKNRKTHGEKVGGKITPEYHSWHNAKQRCNNINSPKYRIYGGRGIKHKLNSVADLINAIGRKPTPQHSLDRINNNGNYEVGNVRWATKKEQGQNTRTNLKYKGECASEVSRRLGGQNSLISQRINKLGWSLEKAFNKQI